MYLCTHTHKHTQIHFLFLPITVHYTNLSCPLAVITFVTCVFVSLALIRFERWRRKRHKPADPFIRAQNAGVEHPKGKYCFSGTVFNVEEKFLIMFCTDEPINFPQSLPPPFPPVWSFLSPSLSLRSLSSAPPRLEEQGDASLNVSD